MSIMLCIAPMSTKMKTPMLAMTPVRNIGVHLRAAAFVIPIIIVKVLSVSSVSEMVRLFSRL
jgi:hypothetical protein